MGVAGQLRLPADVTTLFVSRSFTFLLGWAGPPCGLGLGVVPGSWYSALAFVARPAYPASCILGPPPHVFVLFGPLLLWFAAEQRTRESSFILVLTARRKLRTMATLGWPGRCALAQRRLHSICPHLASRLGSLDEQWPAVHLQPHRATRRTQQAMCNLHISRNLTVNAHDHVANAKRVCHQAPRHDIRHACHLQRLPQQGAPEFSTSLLVDLDDCESRELIIEHLPLDIVARSLRVATTVLEAARAELSLAVGRTAFEPSVARANRQRGPRKPNARSFRSATASRQRRPSQILLLPVQVQFPNTI